MTDSDALFCYYKAYESLTEAGLVGLNIFEESFLTDNVFLALFLLSMEDGCIL